MPEPVYNPLPAAEFFRSGRKTLLFTHASPDGDAVGSICALARLGLALGQDLRMFCETRLPDYLNWIETPLPLLRALGELDGWTPDLAVFLDCPTPERAGREAAAVVSRTLWPQTRILNIDHHPDNSAFGNVNFVEPSAGASAELVGLVAEALGEPLRGPLGEAVYLGLTSDSGNFAYANTSFHLLDMAARIVKNGLRVEEFTQKSENNWSTGRIRLWGELLQNLRFFAGGAVVLTVINAGLLKKHGCGAGDLEGLVSFMRRLKEAKVTVLIREKSGKACKISLRSMGGGSSLDVQKIAALFGGGGHKNAAGAEMDLPAEQAEKILLEALLPAVEACGHERP